MKPCCRMPTKTKLFLLVKAKLFRNHIQLPFKLKSSTYNPGTKCLKLELDRDTRRRSSWNLGRKFSASSTTRTYTSEQSYFCPSLGIGHFSFTVMGREACHRKLLSTKSS